MAAMHASLVAAGVKAGTAVVAALDLYGATFTLLRNLLDSLGVKICMVDVSNLDEVERTIKESHAVALLAETISNPLLKVADVPSLGALAHRYGASMLVDNTFASPYLVRPLKLGADMVVHSATKYLGGHADTMGGIVVSRDEFDQQALFSVMKLVGGVLGVWDAHEILRGLKTLGVRMERQCENARRLASHLNENARISRVHYPNLGALVAIELRDNTRDAAFRFMDALQLGVRSTSLGDVFTSVLHPATSSHRDLLPARREELGIVDGLVRVSVGIENIDDIIADFEQALSA
jgi:cystathionine gamma-synthase/methionine-gamma-lyase